MGGASGACRQLGCGRQPFAHTACSHACRLTGFVQPPDPNNAADLMPPNAPATRTFDGRRVAPPPMLEDFEIELQPKSGGGIFGGGTPPDATADPWATVRSLQRGDK